MCFSSFRVQLKLTAGMGSTSGAAPGLLLQALLLYYSGLIAPVMTALTCFMSD